MAFHCLFSTFFFFSVFWCALLVLCWKIKKLIMLPFVWTNDYEFVHGVAWNREPAFRSVVLTYEIIGWNRNITQFLCIETFEIFRIKQTRKKNRRKPKQQNIVKISDIFLKILDYLLYLFLKFWTFLSIVRRSACSAAMHIAHRHTNRTEPMQIFPSNGIAKPMGITTKLCFFVEMCAVGAL